MNPLPLLVFLLVHLAYSLPLPKDFDRTAKSNDEVMTRIVGGTIAKNRYPWFGQLRYEGRFFCGGSLIAPDLVLTAAHCVADLLVDSVMFKQYTLYRRNRNQIEAKVTSILLHPEYNAQTQDNDIALLVLEQQIPNRQIKPVSLDLTGLYSDAGTNLQVVGFGTTEEGGEVSSRLRIANVPVVGHDACSAKYDSQINEDSMLCAGGESRDTCQGDSGGPLFHSSKAGTFVVGVTSFGVGCGRPGIPGVYARVPSLGPNYVEMARHRGPCKDGFVTLDATSSESFESFSDGWVRYPGNVVKCFLLQTTDPSKKIQLEFDRISTEGEFDTISVYEQQPDGGYTDTGELIDTLSGVEHTLEDPPLVYVSSGSALFVVFKSDASVNFEGFEARYRVFSETTLVPSPLPTPFPTARDRYCKNGVTYIRPQNDGMWLKFDDGHKGAYADGIEKRCYLVVPPKNYRDDLVLVVTSYNTEENYDFVRLYKGNGQTHPRRNQLLSEFTGDHVGDSDPYYARNFLFVLQSDESVNALRAFSAKVRVKTASPTAQPTATPTTDDPVANTCYRKQSRKACGGFGRRGTIAVPCDALSNPCTIDVCKMHCAENPSCDTFSFFKGIQGSTANQGHCELHSNRLISKPRDGACYTLKACS